MDNYEEVIRLTQRGLTVAEIAAALGLAPLVVKVYLLKWYREEVTPPMGVKGG